MIATIAIISGLLQALGYAIYIWKSFRKEVDPNPATWAMFAYGTAALTLLEWDRAASWPLLVLPVVCAVLSIIVAGLCGFRGKLRWPDEWVTRIAFLTDVALTIAYVFVYIAANRNFIPTVERNLLVLTFLVLSNLSTLVSFLPLLKGTWDEPDGEHPLAWTVWATAYATLGVVTFLQEGGINEFMIYPASCCVLHALVAILSLRACRIGKPALRALDS